MVILPNTTGCHNRIMELLNSVPFNTLFAKAVIEQKVKGKIFADNVNDPNDFYILHPYGMSLLLGDSYNNSFNSCFKEYVQDIHKTRTKIEWMQVYPNDWHKVLIDLFEDSSASIEVDTRINFKFNRIKYLENKKQVVPGSDIKIIATTKNDYQQMEGSVIPSNFWNSLDEFMTKGIGYSLYYKDILAGVAFSAFVEEGVLELGIETRDMFRGKNFAYKACSALIDYCLQNEVEPVWACRLTNTGSYNLAQKLGFEESFRTPYYKLEY